MNYDIDMCSGVQNNWLYPCPLRENCKRFVLGKKALDENYYPIWWTKPLYENGKCKIQIKINDEKENQKNG